MRIAICGDDFLNIKQIKHVLYVFSNLNSSLNSIIKVFFSDFRLVECFELMQCIENMTDYHFNLRIIF